MAGAFSLHHSPPAHGVHKLAWLATDTILGKRETEAITGNQPPASPGQQVGALIGRQPLFFATPTFGAFSSSSGFQSHNVFPYPTSSF